MPDSPIILFDRSAASLNEKAYVALEEMIVSGALAPGSQWSELALAERIGIGRTPTREALQKLSYQRLVRIAPRQGIFISEIDYQGHLKVVQARREIEQLVVSQAAQCIGDRERQPMLQVARQLEDIKASKDIATYLRLHFTLTLLLGEGCRNPYAAEFFAMLQTLARRFMNLHQDGYNDFAALCDLHIKQIDAVVSGDAKAAIASAVERNDYAERFARKILMDLIEKSDVTVSRAQR
ncbi:GntR family transcriptional regulator [Xenophilus aerolatus]